MNQEHLKILRASDEVGSLEAPRNFHSPSGLRGFGAFAKRAEKKARMIGPRLASAVGLELQFEGLAQIQDAAHFAEYNHQVVIPPNPSLYTAPGVIRGTESCWGLVTQFSSFGNFVVCELNGGYPELISANQLASARALLASEGYRLFPEETWHAPYEGWAQVHGITTWAERYFGYR